MKKVLIITYYWPPSGGGGVQRWLKFVKYLRDFGWEPIIYTPENPEAPQTDASLLKEIPEDIMVLKTKVWEPYQFYKHFTGRKKADKIQTAFLSEKKNTGLAEKISIWIRGNLFIPDARCFWIKPSVKYLSQWLKENKVDAIVSTGPPHSMHMIALKLQQEHRIPWLADFRDPWTNIDYYQDLMLGKRADRKHHRLELKVLKNADAVTVVSPGMKREFEEIVDRRYTLITNGFDAADFLKNRIYQKTDKFSLAHIGSLVKTRNPKELWQALSSLAQSHTDFSRDLEIRLIGKIDYFVGQSIEKFGLKQYLKEIDYLPHDQVIEEQINAQVLLLFINRTPNAHLILTGKLFEYLGAARPIICIGPIQGDAAQLISKVSAGLVSDFDDVKQLEINIFSYYQAWKNGEDLSKKIDNSRFERRNLTATMAAELNAACDR
ncbi:MAG: glycosyltransferase family 4 protein [Bacteroidetes bacterium]|nr:glycosyltransferase family 4 protein [Bacteroidota bacterium]MBU1579936.1 glycosyltransferase family 4 protein [Bacteroidota bacterium]MBU2556385.1 glycosyltransferase family 4 protein [Bacteroidota bacterium]